jgi:hypothetical protein
VTNSSHHKDASPVSPLLHLTRCVWLLWDRGLGGALRDGNRMGMRDFNCFLLFLFIRHTTFRGKCSSTCITFDSYRSELPFHLRLTRPVLGGTAAGSPYLTAYFFLRSHNRDTHAYTPQALTLMKLNPSSLSAHIYP